MQRNKKLAAPAHHGRVSKCVRRSALALLLGSASLALAPSAFADGFGVTTSPDGWITYTNLLSSTLGLTSQTVTTLTGSFSSDGTCNISESSTPVSASTLGMDYSEETGYNPVTCQERELSGQLSPAAAALAATLNPQDVQPDTPTGSGLAPASTSSASPAAAAATSPQRAYTRTAWVDPFHIVITSMAANLQWPLFGSNSGLTGRNNPYEFPLDGWSNSGQPPLKIVALSDGSGWSSTAAETFKNRDFEYALFILLGPAAFVACGFTADQAVFTHSDTVIGYRRDARGGGFNDSKKGGCANLVHHAKYGGFGWTTHDTFTSQ